jgi:hypothetical protein
VKSGSRNEIPTVSKVVERAAALCDPEGADTAVDALYDGFEDDERPATAAPELDRELEETVEAIDPDGDSPAALMVIACAVWLTTNIEQGHDREHVLREAARLRFSGEPPPVVAHWLDAEGISA